MHYKELNLIILSMIVYGRLHAADNLYKSGKPEVDKLFLKAITATALSLVVKKQTTSPATAIRPLSDVSPLNNATNNVSESSESLTIWERIKLQRQASEKALFAQIAQQKAGLEALEKKNALERKQKEIATLNEHYTKSYRLFLEKREPIEKKIDSVLQESQTSPLSEFSLFCLKDIQARLSIPHVSSVTDSKMLATERQRLDQALLDALNSNLYGPVSGKLKKAPATAQEIETVFQEAVRRILKEEIVFCSDSNFDLNPQLFGQE